MSDKHTQEPWVIGRDDRPGMEWNNHILSGKNPNIAICFMTHDGTDDNEGGEANARRIVACVNACAGIPNEVLETVGSFGGYGSESWWVKITREQSELQSELDSIKQNIAFAATCNHIARMEQAEKQRDELLAALEGETDAVKALMSWCVKNVHKWDFPQYDNLCYWISKREGAIASVKEKA